MKMQFSLTNLIKKMQYGPRLRPTRDWLMLISIIAIVFVIGIVWSVLTFFHAVSSRSVSNHEPTVNTVINHSAINRVQKIFDARAVEQEKYKSGEYSFKDPSR